MKKNNKLLLFKSLLSITAPLAIFLPLTALSSCSNNPQPTPGPTPSVHELFQIQNGILFGFNPELTPQQIEDKIDGDTLKIPEEVLMVNDNAFFRDGTTTIPTSVTKIDFNKSFNLRAIGKCAFKSAPFTRLRFPHSLEIISASAFEDCIRVTSISFLSNVTFGDYAFAGCLALKETDLPDTCNNSNDNIEYGNGVFKNCSSLESFIIMDYVVGLGDSVFEGCSKLKSIIIPQTITSIGEGVFKGCESLQSAVFKGSLKEIKANTFNGCKSLKTITFPNSLENIFQNAFTGCENLTLETLPSTLLNIYDGAFKKCTNLKLLTIPNSVQMISSEAFSECNALQSVIVGNGVLTIGAKAFYKCNALKMVTLGFSIQNIETDAFTDCPNITDSSGSDGKSGFKFNAKEQNWIGINRAANWHSGSTLATKIQCTDNPECDLDGQTQPTTDFDFTISNDNAIVTGYKGTNTDAVIPRFVTTSDFKTYKVTQIGGGQTLTNINRIKKIILPDTIEKINGFAFASSSSLENINLSNLNSLSSIGGSAFKNCTKLKIDGLPSSLTSIGDSAFSNCSSIDKLTIHCDTINNHAFEFCSSLTEVSIDAKKIGVLAFQTCEELQNIVFTNKLKLIYNRAFWGCTKLQSLILPDSITTIDYKAFYNCTSLKYVVIGLNINDADGGINYDAFTETAITDSSGLDGSCGFKYTGTADQWIKVFRSSDTYGKQNWHPEAATKIICKESICGLDDKNNF